MGAHFLRFLSSAGCAILLLQSTSALALDNDNDGVDDTLDAAPCDASVASTQHVPSLGNYASLLYEDQWPARDDLDLNDVVLDYNYLFHKNAQGLVKRIQLSLHVRAHGGLRNMGLALRLPVAANAASTISRSVGSGAAVVTNTLTPQSGESQLVLRIAENIRNEIFDGAANVINVNDAGLQIRGKPIVVNIDLATPLNLTASDAPFDLFIFRSGEFSHQIHRTRFRGTDLMNAALFGQNEDGSDAANGSRFFVDQTGIPFVLELPTSAPHPREQVRIDTLYPDIVTFAQTRGSSNSNFFNFPVNAHAVRLAPAATAVQFPRTDVQCTQCPIIPDSGAPVRQSCRQILAHGESQGDGVYQIDIDGDGPKKAIAVFCDMTTDGGGWTMLARASETNGAGGDYEYRAAMGQQSILNHSFSRGGACDAQYTTSLTQTLPAHVGHLDIQYFCYNKNNRTPTTFWSTGRQFSRADLQQRLDTANPDFLKTQVSVNNADGLSFTGNYAFFGREESGAASCGNTFAGQSGFKPNCSQSGQGVLSPRGVWMLTHYTGNFTEVTSCGAQAGSVLPFFVGEIRYREHDCQDGIKNDTESDVDCGGVCGDCVAGKTCDDNGDCQSGACRVGVCQEQPATAAASCLKILQAGLSQGNGTYFIDPDGAGGNAPMPAFCDMTTDGGGWTVLARASDTNGVGGDYEYRAVMGQQSLLNNAFSRGKSDDAQYTTALNTSIPTSSSNIELQYFCYNRNNPSTTTFWSKISNLSLTTLRQGLSTANPDFLLTGLSLRNADGTSYTGNYGFFGREEAGTASCGNSFAGQSGLKPNCSQSGQGVLNPRGVWMLTHYTGNFTEVTSCGGNAGSVLPFFVGEVRYRELN